MGQFPAMFARDDHFPNQDRPWEVPTFSGHNCLGPHPTHVMAGSMGVGWGGVGKLFGGFAFVFVHLIYLRWWSQLTRLGLFRAARSANQTMQIYGNTIVQDGSTRFAARCSLFLIVSITYYWHDIDVRYSIMYYIYIIAKHIVNTSEGSKKVGFGVVWYHRSWGT